MSTAVAVYDPAFAFEQMMKQAYEAGRRAGKKEAQEELAEVVAVTKASKLSDAELVYAYNSRRRLSSKRTGIELGAVPPIGQETRVSPFGPPIEVKGKTPLPPQRAGDKTRPYNPDGVSGSGNSVSVEGGKSKEKPAPPWGKQLQVGTQQAQQQDGGVPIIDVSDPAARAYANRVFQIKYGTGVQS